MKYIDIGGERRPIHYTVNALTELEDLTGLDLTEDDDRRKLSKLRNIRSLAYVGLKHGLKKEKGKAVEIPFSIEDVGDWITADSIEIIMGAFLEDKQTDDAETEPEEGKKKLDGVTSR